MVSIITVVACVAKLWAFAAIEEILQNWWLLAYEIQDIKQLQFTDKEIIQQQTLSHKMQDIKQQQTLSHYVEKWGNNTAKVNQKVDWKVKILR